MKIFRSRDSWLRRVFSVLSAFRPTPNVRASEQPNDRPETHPNPNTGFWWDNGLKLLLSTMYLSTQGLTLGRSNQRRIIIRGIKSIWLGRLTQNTNQIQKWMTTCFSKKCSHFVWLKFKIDLPPWERLGVQIKDMQLGEEIKLISMKHILIHKSFSRETPIIDLSKEFYALNNYIINISYIATIIIFIFI